MKLTVTPAYELRIGQGIRCTIATIRSFTISDGNSIPGILCCTTVHLIGAGSTFYGIAACTANYLIIACETFEGIFSSSVILTVQVVIMCRTGSVLEIGNRIALGMTAGGRACPVCINGNSDAPVRILIGHGIASISTIDGVATRKGIRTVEAINHVRSSSTCQRIIFVSTDNIFDVLKSRLLQGFS